MIINVGLLNDELLSAGLPVCGVSSDGRVDYTRALTQAEQATAAGIVAAHDPNGKTQAEKRTAASKATLLSLRGREITKLASPEREVLLAAVCQMLGLADAEGKIL